MPLTITPANVLQVGSNETVLEKDYPLGQAGTAGQAVALDKFTDPDNPTWKLLDTNDPTNGAELAGKDGVGILLTDGATGQPCTVALPGAIIDLGVTLEAGELYAGGATPGEIEKFTSTEPGSGERITILGYANDNDHLILIQLVTGYQRA